MSKQDFYQLRRKCRAKGKLFEDPDFPAVRESLFFSGGGPKQKLEWKRPHEICKDPQLFVGGASRFDVSQGMLGDCWFVAVLSSLGQDEKLMSQVVPSDQSFEDDYAGIFHFRFWRFGEWIDVIVDDRLPTYYNKLIFIHSEEKNEFWSALLEKAYAKLHGSYEALKGGKASEAMVDFTGGVTEAIDLRKPSPKLFRNLLKASERNALMSCSIGAKTRKDMEAKLDNGLVKGHAYSVTRVAKAALNNGKEVELIRIRNPWGNEREWNGAWSDGSSEWNQVSQAEKEKLGLNYDDDGESWMSWRDFVHNFTDLEVCSMGADDIDEDTPAKAFKQSSAQAKWSKGVTAGGCRNFPTFEKNPQFIVDLNEADDDDDDGLCSVLFALMQKDRRAKRHLGAQDLCVGISIYQVSGDFEGKLDKKYFDYHKSTATSGSFTNLREVAVRLDLKPGRYVIIPCTFNPDEECSFLLRIFSEKDTGQSAKGSGQLGGGSAAQEKGQTNDAMRQMFERLAGSDKEIDPDELQEIFSALLKNELRGGRLRIETCRAIIGAVDKDYSGKLNLDEFTAVLTRIKKWQYEFKRFDRTRTGHVRSEDLAKLLQKIGESVSASMARILILRFSSGGRISFDDFVSCVLRVEAVQAEFKKYAKGEKATFDLEQFASFALAL